MIFRLFIFLIGFGLAVSGGVTIIAYLNIIPMGYTFLDYLLFISNKTASFFFIMGIILITLSIYLPLEKK